MKKVLVPAAMLLGMASAAQAQVTLYGLLDVSYGKSVFSDSIDQREDFHSGGDNGSSEGNSTSRFGLKGSTDVGGGVKANFKLESGGIDSDGEVNDNGAFFNRQAWFGLSGSFGEFRLGRQDALAFQTAVDYDFNGASNGVSALYYTSAAPWNGFTGRQSRQLSYYTPTFGGFKGAVAFVPNGNGGTAIAGTDSASTANKESYSAALTYATGPISVTANYETERNDELGHDFASVIGSYDFGVAKVMLGYVKAAENYEGISTGLVAPVAGVNVGFLAAYNTDTDGYGVELFANKEIYKNVIAYVEGAFVSRKAPINTTDRFGPGTPKNDSSTGFALGLIYLF
jgi:general bacterial porin, GBP family